MHPARRVLKTNAMFRGVLRARATKGRSLMRSALVQATISLLCVTALLVPVRSEAVVIDIVSAGFEFRQLVGGRPQAPGAFSDATLLSIGNAAGDYWESRLVGDQSIRIELGFAALGSDSLGRATVGGFAIALTNDRRYSWFVDPTPFDNSEYGNSELAFADLGGGLLNTGYNFFDSTGDAAVGYDAFTVLLHEVGHILSGRGLAFAIGMPSILIDDPLPFSGTVVPLTVLSDPGHIALGGSLLSAGIGFGDRALPSDLDILYVAQLGGLFDDGGFDGVNLNRFTAVPEPATLLLFLVGLVMMRYIGTRPFRIPQRSTFTHIAR